LGQAVYKSDVLSNGLPKNLSGKEFGMENFVREKHLGVVIILVSLSSAWIFGIANAQTAEEGTANFYSDKFQGKKTAAARFMTRTNSLRHTKPFPTEPRCE
jgi:rare lipoprotein A (peptidoglycan hydrolase)